LSVMCSDVIWIALPACGTGWSPALGHSSSRNGVTFLPGLNPNRARDWAPASIWVQDNNDLHYPSGLLRDGGSHHRGAPALHRVRAHVGGRDDETGELHSEDDNGGWLGRVVSARVPGGDSLGAIALRLKSNVLLAVYKPAKAAHPRPSFTVSVTPPVSE
jgi:hypothetical protein